MLQGKRKKCQRLRVLTRQVDTLQTKKEIIGLLSKAYLLLSTIRQGLGKRTSQQSYRLNKVQRNLLLPNIALVPHLAGLGRVTGWIFLVCVLPKR